MKTLNLKIQGGIELRPIIEIDGKVVNYKRNKYKTILITHETEKEAVDVKIKNVLEINGPWWWLVQMCFFVLSLFGILNPKLEKTCYYINYQAKITLNAEQNNVNLKFNELKDKSRAIEAVFDGEVEETENAYSIDLEAKKRKKILKFSKIVSWVLLIIIVLAIIIAKKG